MSRTMKDSGIPWIGEIPEGWRNAKYRYSGIFVKGKLPCEQNVEQHGKPIIGASEMLGKEYRNFSLDANVPTCQKQDILILWDGANAGIVANNCEGIVSSTVVKYVCTDKNIDSQFLFYLFKNGEPFFKSKVNGTTIPHMNQKFIDEYLCILPPLAEQHLIATFLDKKCSEIDSLIDLQEQMIEELKAYKQSVITEAVTKGLNPNVPMKDSGIEWIGDVPEEWEVHPFKAYYKTTKGLNITKENLVERGIPVISYGQIHSKLNTGTSVCDALIRYVPETYLESNPECLSKKYDIFFADTSEDVEGAGNIAFVDTDTPIFAGYHTIIARPKKEVKTKYFAYLAKTDAWRTQIRNSLSGVKVFSISQKLINRVCIIIPPLAEQQAIADYLDKKCGEIDELITIKQQKIDSLKEYKKSVIYEYVTGKREV